MAQRVDEPKYEAMISALNTFASNVYSASSEMQSLAYMCTQALGEKDKAAEVVYSKIKDGQLKYADACSLAKSIAVAMQEELEELRKEDQILNSDE